MLGEEEQCKITHGLRMIANLEDLLKSNIVCDFLINIGDSSFPTHRAVLAACSEYFRAILAEGIDQGVVYISGVSPEAMQQCIQFMYSGEASITLTSVESILNAADLFQIDALIELCYIFIQRNLSPSNCLDIRNMVVVFENAKFRETIDAFIVEKMNEVVETTAFKMLHKQDMKYYLKMWRSNQRSNSAPMRESKSAMHTPRIFLPSKKAGRSANSAKSCKIVSVRSKSPVQEDKRSQSILLWKGVFSWVSHDPTERRAEFLELLKFIKVGRFTINFLATTIWRETIVSENTSIKEFIAVKVLANIAEVKYNLSIQNCLNIFHMMTTYCKDSYDRLLKIVMAYMATNLKKLKKRSEVERWRLDEFCLFFKTCDRTTLDEADIWDTAMTWIKFEKDREESVMDVLEVLNIEAFTPKFVIAVVLREPVMKESGICVKHVSDLVFKDPKHIVWNTTIDTCFTLKYLSRKYKNTAFAAMEKEIVSFMFTNFLKVIEHQEFRNLTFHEVLQLAKILQKRNVHGEAKWKAVMKWVKHDPDLRRRHLPSLLRTISFERLTSNFLRETVRKETLVTNFPECNDLVMNAVYDKLP